MIRGYNVFGILFMALALGVVVGFPIGCAVGAMFRRRRKVPPGDTTTYCAKHGTESTLRENALTGDIALACIQCDLERQAK